MSGTTINGTAGRGILVDNTSGYTLTVSAALQLVNAQSWTNNSSNALTVSGLVSGTGALTKSGSGTLILSNTSDSYSGQLTIQAGTLSIATINGASSNGVLGNSASSVILGGAGGSTGTLDYTGVSGVTSTKKFTLATGGTGTFAVSTGVNTLTLSNVIDGSGSLAKIGTGTLILTNIANTYSGTTTISDGILQASKIASGGTSSLGSATTAVVLGGINTAGTLTAGTLKYAGAGATTFTRGFTVNAGGGGITNASTTSNGTALLTIATNGIAAGGNITFATNSNGIAVNSVISGPGSVTMNSSGAGVLTLAGANTYSGGTIVTQGTVSLSGAGTLGATGGALTVDGGTLNLNGTSQGAGNLTGAGGTIVNDANNTHVTLTIGNGNGGGGNYAGVIADNSGAGSGTLALTKIGTGNITLSGINTYTGATTISEGTLSAANLGAGNSSLGNASTAVVLGGIGTKGTLNYLGTDTTTFTGGFTVNAGGGAITNLCLLYTSPSPRD